MSDLEDPGPPAGGGSHSPPAGGGRYSPPAGGGSNGPPAGGGGHGHGDRPARWLPEFAHPVRPPERPGPPPKRVRVVLAERKRARRVVRTLAEVEEQTGVGEMLVRQLIRAQLSVSLWLALFVAVTVGALPAVFYYVEDLRAASLLGIRLPWLLLGVAVYPFILGVGWVYVRLAERNEQTFINMVED